MAGRYLLDTNAVIAVFDNDQSLRKLMKGSPAFLSATVMGELYFGVEKSRHSRANRTRLEAFAVETNILVDDQAVARRYGEIKHQLQKRGRPIPENDIWIAAAALEHSLTLLTRDEHFSHVEGLSVEDW